MIATAQARRHGHSTAVHGLAVEHRLPDALHPGKTNKRQRREFILSRAVFCFHYARGLGECVTDGGNVPIKDEQTILKRRMDNHQYTDSLQPITKNKSGRPMTAPTVSEGVCCVYKVFVFSCITHKKCGYLKHYTKNAWVFHASHG